jgi:hypothetical protein
MPDNGHDWQSIRNLRPKATPLTSPTPVLLRPRPLLHRACLPAQSTPLSPHHPPFGGPRLAAGAYPLGTSLERPLASLLVCPAPALPAPPSCDELPQGLHLGGQRLTTTHRHHHQPGTQLAAQGRRRRGLLTHLPPAPASPPAVVWRHSIAITHHTGLVISGNAWVADLGSRLGCFCPCSGHLSLGLSCLGPRLSRLCPCLGRLSLGLGSVCPVLGALGAVLVGHQPGLQHLARDRRGNRSVGATLSGSVAGENRFAQSLLPTDRPAPCAAAPGAPP